MLTGLDATTHIYERTSKLVKKIKDLNPPWLATFIVKLNENYAHIQNQFKKMEEDRGKQNYHQFIKKNLLIVKGSREEEVQGKKIIKVITRRLNIEWDFLKPLYNLIYRPLWFSKDKPIKCTLCRKQWGSKHINECDLLYNYRGIIALWREKGLLRYELYFNVNQMHRECNTLKEAYQIIEDHKTIN